MAKFDIYNLSKRQYLLIGGGVLLLLVVIIVVNFLISNRDPYPDNGIKITNLHELTRGKKDTSTERVLVVQNDLLDLAQKNSSMTVVGSDVKDAVARPESFAQTDSRNGLHTVRFLVDIASLQQTYDVSYQWAKNPELLEEYGTLVSCPKPEDNRYEDFHCQDDFSEQTGLPDPIKNVLPITNLLFSLRYREPAATGAPWTILVEGGSEPYLRLAVQELKRLTAINPADYRLEFSPKASFEAEIDLPTHVISQPSGVLNMYPEAANLYDISCSALQAEYTLCKLNQWVDENQEPYATYRALVKQVSGGYVLTGKPEPLLSLPNNPNVPIDVLTAANNA